MSDEAKGAKMWRRRSSGLGSIGACASNYPVDVREGSSASDVFFVLGVLPQQVTGCCPEALWRQRGQVLRRIFGLVNKVISNYSRVCYLFALFLNIHLKIKTTLNYLSLLGAKRPPEGHP